MEINKRMNVYNCLFSRNQIMKLVSESGPPHSKTFRVKCSFGTKPAAESSSESATSAAATDGEKPTGSQQETSEPSSSSSSYFEVFGEGRSKKAANKEAAKSMIKIIEEKFEPLLSVAAAAANQTKKKRAAAAASTTTPMTGRESNESGNGRSQSKRRPRTAIVKVKKTSPEYGKGSINPISRLIQIQQAKNEPEPVFELISSTNKANTTPASLPPQQQQQQLVNGQVRKGEQLSGGRRTEFLMQVTLKQGANGEVFKIEGKGPTKKAAKQKAAEAMLSKLGYMNSKANLKPVLKNPTESSASNSPAAAAATEPNGSTQSPQTSETTPAAAATTTTTTTSADDKGEKRVKFSEEDLVVTLDPAKSTDPGRSSK